MPTKGLDCIGFAAYALGNDGRLCPVDLSQTVTISNDDDTDENAWSIDTDGMSCTLETRINRALLKAFFPWRKVRQRIRGAEKERRKRLKEDKQ